MIVRFDGHEYQASTATQLIEIIKPIRWDAHSLPTAQTSPAERRYRDPRSSDV